MSTPRPVQALARSLVSAALLALAGPAWAQTANGSPTAPAAPGLVGTPRPVSRTAPSVGGRRPSPDGALPAARMRPLRKPTAAERAEQRKLEHDLNICIGC